MKSHRIARVNAVVREVAANAILFQVKDPRVKGVTVTRAEVSADMQHAKIYVSVMGTEGEQRTALHGLRSAAAFIQTQLADRLTSRYVPHVTFVKDEGVKKSIEIARLIREGLETGSVPPAAADAEGPGADAEGRHRNGAADRPREAETPGTEADGPGEGEPGRG